VARRVVFLAPGFFGFTSLGDASYFKDVERSLGQSLDRRGTEAKIVICPTAPTGSIPRRADRLRHHVLVHCNPDADTIHFVGHSTGGLDVRLLLAPGVRIGGGDSAERIAAATCSATSLVSPHHGAPIAGMFATTRGSALLLLIASLATTGRLQAVRDAASRATSIAAGFGDRIAGTGGLIDESVTRLLAAVRFGDDDEVWKYLDEIVEDQGALLQLTPEGTHLFSAAVHDRKSVDYGCVVAGTAAPGVQMSASAVLKPVQAASHVLYSVLYKASAMENSRYPYPEPSAAVRQELEKALGFDVDARTNDGIVPTLSQLHGRLIHADCADHLDVVGHYSRAPEGTGDWLPSGAGFTVERFELLWDRIAEAIVAAEDRR
jgi:triacylglycerol lipase